MSEMPEKDFLKIRELNDLLRTTGRGGTIQMTNSVARYSKEDIAVVIDRIISFSDFNDGDDPYGEHDFGSFDFKDEKIFWKIDYYDKAMDFGSDDPADPEQTERVLLIMLAEDY